MNGVPPFKPNGAAAKGEIANDLCKAALLYLKRRSKIQLELGIVTTKWEANFDFDCRLTHDAGRLCAPNGHSHRAK
jgi:hypothetical protein